jgi:hypothetical protein
MTVNIKWILGGLALIAYQATIGGGFGNLQAQMQQGNLTRQQRQSDASETQARQIALDKLKQQSPIANARYEADCQLVVSAANSKQSTAIVVGAPVIIAGTNTPLSVGNLVCDSNGFTAEIVLGTYNGNPSPVAGLEARTMDRKVVDAALARYRSKGVQVKQNAQ